MKERDTSFARWALGALLVAGACMPGRDQTELDVEEPETRTRPARFEPELPNGRDPSSPDSTEEGRTPDRRGATKLGGRGSAAGGGGGGPTGPAGEPLDTPSDVPPVDVLEDAGPFEASDSAPLDDVDAGPFAPFDSGSGDPPRNDVTDAEPDEPLPPDASDSGPHPAPAVLSMSLALEHTCAILQGGLLKCWGHPLAGRLGNQSDRVVLGDDETPRMIAPLEVGGRVIEVAAGHRHTCALLEGGHVRCWGDGRSGRLGYGNARDFGIREPLTSRDFVDVGERVIQIVAGTAHTCALLDSGSVKCWGRNAEAQLGVGHTDAISERDTPANTPPVDLGESALALSTSASHTCALLSEGRVRCWGKADAGQLGYGKFDIADVARTPAAAGDVQIGGPAVSVSAGSAHTCAVLESGELRCWGLVGSAQLGDGKYERSDLTLPAQAPSVELGGERAVGVAAAGQHTCVLLEGGFIKCWGIGRQGRLGNASTVDPEREPPANMPYVDVGGTAIDLRAGDAHTCALLDSNQLVCWGEGLGGRLGYGNAAENTNVGDDEVPAAAGVLQF